MAKKEVARGEGGGGVLQEVWVLEGVVCPECGAGNVMEGRRNYRVRKWGGPGTKLERVWQGAAVMALLCGVMVVGLVGAEWLALRSKGYQSSEYGDWSWVRAHYWEKIGMNGWMVWESRWLFDQFADQITDWRNGDGRSEWGKYWSRSFAFTFVSARQEVVCEIDFESGEQTTRIYSDKAGRSAAKYGTGDLGWMSALGDEEVTGVVYDVGFLGEAAARHKEFYEQLKDEGGQADSLWGSEMLVGDVLMAMVMKRCLYVGWLGDDGGDGSGGMRHVELHGGDDPLITGFERIAKKEECVAVDGRVYMFGQMMSTPVMGNELEIYVAGCLDSKEKRLLVRIEEAGDFNGDVIGFDGYEGLAGFDLKKRRWVGSDGHLLVNDRERLRLGREERIKSKGSVLEGLLRSEAHEYQMRVNMNSFSMMSGGKAKFLMNYELVRLGDEEKRWTMKSGGGVFERFYIDEKGERLFAANDTDVFMFELEGLGEVAQE
ncbi:hypothetical protein JD969_11790 [Planctomycetota bacterium]|nr:hypothetical protein JD969_11790 [Planctomycetota bacterium]